MSSYVIYYYILLSDDIRGQTLFDSNYRQLYNLKNGERYSQINLPAYDHAFYICHQLCFSGL
mgnify:FL=1